MTLATAYLEIANLRVALQGNPELIEIIRERYAGFLTDSAQISIELKHLTELQPKFGNDENIPEIRYLENGFAVDQAPFFFIDYNQKTQTGGLRFTSTIHKKAGSVPPDESPLSFGLRRGIGVLFVTLLAQDAAPGFHATALQVNGHGLIAPGDSGTGKSTFFAMFPEPMQLNDEFVIVRSMHNGPQVFSTPFSETWDKARKNRSAPLRLLVKLVQAPIIQSKAIDNGEVVRILNHNLILPVGAEQEYRKGFQVFTEVAENIRAVELAFTLEKEAVVNKLDELTRAL